MTKGRSEVVEYSKGGSYYLGEHNENTIYVVYSKMLTRCRPLSSKATLRRLLFTKHPSTTAQQKIHTARATSHLPI